MSVLAYFGFSVDDCGGMDSGGVAGRLVEKFDRLGPRQIGILAAQHSRVNGGKVFGDYYSGRFGCLCSGVVLGIGDKG